MQAVADARNVDTVMVDGTSVRVLRSAATLKKRPASMHGAVARRFDREIHARTKQDGLPIRHDLTPGQAHDAPPCERRLDSLQPGQYLLADKAYEGSVADRGEILR